MRIERFEDIDAWKERRELVKVIYECFKDNKDIILRIKFKERLFL